jgi:hypothetical protein
VAGQVLGHNGANLVDFQFYQQVSQGYAATKRQAQLATALGRFSTSSSFDPNSLRI